MARNWIRPARRWFAAALACGPLAAPGVGCRSAAGVTVPPVRQSPPYPHMPAPDRLPAGWPNAPARTAAADPDGVTPAGAQAAADPGGPLADVPAVPPPAADAETIDLGVALRLAGVGNPTINLAREQVREALAGQLAARVLLLPSTNIGTNYHYHSGPLQASFGGIRNIESQSLYVGFGARTLAAESVAFPGVRLFAHLGDAAYEPLAARQRVAARRAEAVAVENETLLRVAAAYLELIGAEARREVLQEGEAQAAELVRLTKVYAEKGQGRQADFERADARLELVRRQLRRTDEDVAVASARLCRLLSLDPSVRLRTPGGAVRPFTLIPEDGPAEPLVEQAARTRPEVVARAAELQEAQVRVKQEQVRPLLPLVSVGYSGGLFGGGGSLVSYQFSPLQGRSDFDAFAVWNLQNLGFGNRAQVNRTRAVVGEAVAEFDRTVNRVRREVVEAQAEARAAARGIELARTAVATAEEGFRLDVQRIRQGGPDVGRPIEVLDSFRQLLDARQELVRAVVGYDTAQFRLFVAVGTNPLAGCR